MFLRAKTGFLVILISDFADFFLCMSLIVALYNKRFNLMVKFRDAWLNFKQFDPLPKEFILFSPQNGIHYRYLACLMYLFREKANHSFTPGDSFYL